MPVLRRGLVGVALCAALVVSAAPVVGGGREHTVVLVGNAFSPENLVIEVGDTVRWNNGFFDIHNVYSCVPEQFGCEGETATESFSSGAGVSGPWTFRHTFTLPGPNRYLCQPHAAFMWGTVTVVGTPSAVPDGRSGVPVGVDRDDPAGAAVRIAWDTDTCGLNPDHLLVWGEDVDLPTGGGIYGIAGGVCGLGAQSPYAWEEAPTPDPGRFVWWLIVATDGAGTEGSWGSGNLGERNGPGPAGSSGTCGAFTKDTANTCGL